MHDAFLAAIRRQQSKRVLTVDEEGTRGMIITTTYGSEVFENSHAKFHVFSHKCLTRPPQQTQAQQVSGRGNHKGFCFTWLAAKDDPTGFGVSRIGSQRKFPAAPGLREEFGSWKTCQFQVVEGGIIRLFGSRKVGRGPPALLACMFLEVHEHAPLLKVYARLTGDHRAQGPEVLVFEGKAYPITLGQATDLQVVVDGYNGAAYEDYNQEVLFRVHEVVPATMARQRVVTSDITNSDGQVVRIRRAVRRRAIQV